MYENYLISKIFVFQVVNSFASLSYIAFVKSFLGFTCSQDNCSLDMANTLSTIFLSSLLSRALLQVDLPYPNLRSHCILFLIYFIIVEGIRARVSSRTQRKSAQIRSLDKTAYPDLNHSNFTFFSSLPWKTSRPVAAG